MIKTPPAFMSELGSSAYVLKNAINRNDDLELREKILGMTAAKRERLGINKSTLWHIRKNLSEGKTPKIYEEILLKIQ